MNKNYKEVTGKILSCAVGYNATLIIGKEELITSKVVKISMIHDSKFYFETENSIYIVEGAIV